MYTHVYEYIWRDGDGKFRSKTRVVKDNDEECNPQKWNYDGSSTGQATTENSEIELFPVSVVWDPFRSAVNDGYTHLVLCETSAQSETRGIAVEVLDLHKENEPMFGFEQEFFMYDANTNVPLGWNTSLLNNDPKENSYCGVGINSVKQRDFLEKVLDNCLYAELSLTGWNFEVAVGQAEFQVCDVGIDAADNLMLFRYILERTAELYDISINYHCKPLGPRWSGSGLHTNFSTIAMRVKEDATEDIMTAIEKLEKSHDAAMKVYGTDNNLRLTGKHETSSYDKFTFGVGSRSTSVRIPADPKNKHYFEDRRPGGNADPYLVSAYVYKTVCLYSSSDDLDDVDVDVCHEEDNENCNCVSCIRGDNNSQENCCNTGICSFHTRVHIDEYDND